MRFYTLMDFLFVDELPTKSLSKDELKVARARLIYTNQAKIVGKQERAQSFDFELYIQQTINQLL